MASDPIDVIAVGISESSITPTPAQLAEESVRRTHVDRLDEAVHAEVNVEAPGYEKMLASTRWEELPLSEDIIKGVRAKGWERPSKIQAQALPYILRADKPNLLAQAKNGSGKTGSFGLAMLAVVDPNLAKPQSLCICPARELAIQTTKVLQQLAKFTRIQVAAVIGGVMYTEPILAHVIVVTPGKVQEVIKNKLLNLSAIKVFVLDEADDMIENFAAECNMVKRAASAGRKQPPQVLLFSASFECLEPSHPFAKRAKDFTDLIIDRSLRVPIVIRVTSNELKLENVTQFFVQLPPQRGGPNAEFDAKLKFLLSMYDTLTVGKTMIFVQSRKGAQALADAMRAQGHNPSVITGDKANSQEDRVRVYEEFERGVTKVLITTDLMTRGIDMQGMKLVINFDLPWLFEEGIGFKGGHVHFATFQHRVGRVGRFGTVGAAIHLLANDADARALQEINRHFDLSMLALKADSPEEAAVQVEEAMEKPPSMQMKRSEPAIPVFGVGAPAAAGGGGASSSASAPPSTAAVAAAGGAATATRGAAAVTSPLAAPAAPAAFPGFAPAAAAGAPLFGSGAPPPFGGFTFPAFGSVPASGTAAAAGGTVAFPAFPSFPSMTAVFGASTVQPASAAPAGATTSTPASIEA